jgi:hypothetical protein
MTSTVIQIDSTTPPVYGGFRPIHNHACEAVGLGTAAFSSRGGVAARMDAGSASGMTNTTVIPAKAGIHPRIRTHPVLSGPKSAGCLVRRGETRLAGRITVRQACTGFDRLSPNGIESQDTLKPTRKFDLIAEAQKHQPMMAR